MSARKLAFIGLGVMGGPMAGHLARAGHDVTVYNRTAAPAAAWTDRYGGTARPTPRAAAEGADIVFACVGNDDDLRAVTLGAEGAFAGMRPGAIFVDQPPPRRMSRGRCSRRPLGWGWVSSTRLCRAARRGPGRVR